MAPHNQEKSPVDTAKLEQQVAGQKLKDGIFAAADDTRNADGSSFHGGEDILALQDLDPALNMKMHLVNNVSNGTVGIGYFNANRTLGS